MGINILCRNIHTGLRQAQEPEPIVSYSACPVLCACPIPSPIPIPVQCECVIRPLIMSTGITSEQRYSENRWLKTQSAFQLCLIKVPTVLILIDLSQANILRNIFLHWFFWNQGIKLESHKVNTYHSAWHWHHTSMIRRPTFFFLWWNNFFSKVAWTFWSSNYCEKWRCQGKRWNVCG